LRGLSNASVSFDFAELFCVRNGIGLDENGSGGLTRILQKLTFLFRHHHTLIQSVDEKCRTISSQKAIVPMRRIPPTIPSFQFPNQGQSAIGQQQDPIEMMGKLFGVMLSQFTRSLTPEKPSSEPEPEQEQAQKQEQTQAESQICKHLDRLDSSIERLSNQIDELRGQLTKLESEITSKLANTDHKHSQTVGDTLTRLRDDLSQSMDVNSKRLECELSRLETIVSRIESRHGSDLCEVKVELAGLKRSIPSQRYHIERISPDYRLRDDRRVDGIISWLSRTNGEKNLEDLGLVRVITDVPCSSNYVAKNILDVRTNSLYLSKTQNDPGKWIGYDFGELIRIVPTHYAIRSNVNGKGGAHLKSWVIEVSNDPSPNSGWQTIDERQSRDELNAQWAIGVFSVSKPPSEEYRYIRLKSTGPTWYGDHWLYLSGFEVFGELRLCESATK
jgi:hypothetical protein